jgi:hypothetical protein
MIRNSGTWAMRTATPIAASGPSPYAAARLLSTSDVTIRKPDWSSSPTPTPRTGFMIDRDSENQRGETLLCSLRRWSHQPK